jgi:hypothetical protein
LDAGDLFGVSVSSIGKYGDMYALLVGARADDDSASNAGAAWVLFIEGEISSGYENIVLNEDFIYNNPVENTLFVKTNVTGLDLVIYNITGKELIRKKMVDSETIIDMSSCPSGIYLGVLEKQGYRRAFKVIKK